MRDGPKPTAGSMKARATSRLPCSAKSFALNPETKLGATYITCVFCDKYCKTAWCVMPEWGWGVTGWLAVTQCHDRTWGEDLRKR